MLSINMMKRKEKNQKLIDHSIIMINIKKNIRNNSKMKPKFVFELEDLYDNLNIDRISLYLIFIQIEI